MLTDTKERPATDDELRQSTFKSRARLETIVEEPSCEYDSLWYFAPERLRPRLIEFAQTTPYDNVTVHHYPPVVADWQRRPTLPYTAESRISACSRSGGVP